MPLSKKYWIIIGNSLLGVLVLAMVVVGFFIFPTEILHSLDPYTGTVAESMKVIFYIPLLFPCAICLATVGFYYRFGRSIQDAFIGCAMLLFVCTTFFIPLLYTAIKDDFLTKHIIYRDNCRSIGIDVFIKGYDRILYAKIVCDRDPNVVLKEWDPDIIAYLANHPENAYHVYQVSAADTLSFPPSNSK